MALEENNVVRTLATSSDSKQFLVYQQVKEDILNNTYPAGTVMVERKLCEIYNVSRSPLRNALQQLSHEGLLSFVPGKGVIVPDYTIEDILEVYDLIEMLHIFAIQSSIKKMNAVSLEALHVILDNMKKSMNEGNLLVTTRWDQKFHKFIITCASNKRLDNIYTTLNFQSMRFIASVLEDSELAEKSYLEHLDIYNLLVSQNISGAEKAIRTHYQNIKQYYINKLISRIPL